MSKNESQEAQRQGSSDHKVSNINTMTEFQIYEALKPIFINPNPTADEVFDMLHGKSVLPERFNSISTPTGIEPAAQPAEEWVAVALAELQRIYDKYGYEQTGMVIRNIEALSAIK